MGVSTVTAARILKGQLQHRKGEESLLEMDKFPYVALAKVSLGRALQGRWREASSGAEIRSWAASSAGWCPVPSAVPGLTHGKGGEGGAGPLLSSWGCLAGEKAPFVVKLQAPAPYCSRSLQGMLVGVQRAGFALFA